MPLSIGDVVEGRHGKSWHAIRQLGSGTCCQVYCVSLVGDQTRKGALKIYKKAANYEEAHHRESLLLNLLLEASTDNCPEIVRVLDDFTYQGHSCLVEDLCDLSLRQILHINQGREGLPPYTLIKVLQDLLRGLNILHRVGFVHGDIKPTNLLWSAQEGRLKLIDFSLSFHHQDKVIGKIQSKGYEAPEVRRKFMHKKYTGITVDQIEKRSTGKPGESSSGDPTHDIGNRGNVNGKGEDMGGREAVISCVSDAVTLPTVETCSHPRPKETAKDGVHDTAPCDCGLEVKVGPASDVWSVGCVLMELMLGHKLTELTDATSTEFIQGIIKQQVQCGVGRHHPTTMIAHSSDLVSKMLICEPADRISVEEALRHPMFTLKSEPVFFDLILLPTCILRFLNILDEGETQDEELYSDILEDMREECGKHGDVISCVIPKHGPAAGKVFVEFALAEHAMLAYSKLCKRVYRDRTVVITYFPLQDWQHKHYF